MRRKTFDAILTAGGAVLAAVLVVAGALLMWGYSFASTTVHNQLAREQIYFPTQAEIAKAAPGTEITPAMVPYLSKYAGQQLLTGAQAEVYADHFIQGHLQNMGGGKSYSQLSAESLAQPTNTKLAALVNTVFKGETLRGLLLNAYAFGTFAQIALISAIVSFIGAGLMLILTALGVWHLRRVSPEEEVLTFTGHKAATLASA